MPCVLPRAVAARPFIDIATRGSSIIGIKVGLAVAKLDVATLLKTIIMVRRYKRLRRGRFEFGAPIPRLASKHDVIGKILSGGQTGVDRAALDVAIELGVPRGGWCPKGRRAEDGVIAKQYPLRETPSTDYRERTRRNVRDADGTLIVTADELRGGTALTRALAEKTQEALPGRGSDATHERAPDARLARHPRYPRTQRRRAARKRTARDLPADTKFSATTAACRRLKIKSVVHVQAVLYPLNNPAQRPDAAQKVVEAARVLRAADQETVVVPAADFKQFLR